MAQAACLRFLNITSYYNILFLLLQEVIAGENSHPLPVAEKGWLFELPRSKLRNERSERRAISGTAKGEKAKRKRTSFATFYHLIRHAFA